jgi:hypothetical protein
MYFIKTVFGIELALYIGWKLSSGLLSICIASDTKAINVHFGIKKSKWQFGHTQNTDECPLDFFGLGPLFLVGYKL